MPCTPKHLSLTVLAGGLLLTCACASTQPKAVGPEISLNPQKFSSNFARSELRERAIELLSAAALDELPASRANAIEGLQLAPSRMVGVTRAALSDLNPGVRFVAAMSAGKLQLHELEPFLRPLLADPDTRVRMAAIYALARIGEDVPRDLLASQLLNGEPSHQSQAAFILGELGDASATALLRDASRRANMRGKRDGGSGGDLAVPIEEVLVRLQIAEAMLKLGDTSVRSVLQTALYPSRRDDFEAAVLAAQALGETRDRSAISQLVRIVEQSTATGTDDPNPRSATFIMPPELRLAAATALAKMGYPDGLYVADQYSRDAAPALRAQSAFLYGLGAKPLDLAKLDYLLQDPELQVRIAAAAAILKALSPR